MLLFVVVVVVVVVVAVVVVVVVVVVIVVVVVVVSDTYKAPTTLEVEKYLSGEKNVHTKHLKHLA